MNQTEMLDNTTTSVTSDMMAWANSSSDSELEIGFAILANGSAVENVTDEVIRSLDCATVIMEYGIIASVICCIAFVVGVIFCMFGE